MKYIIVILKTPYWILSVLTQAKSFKDNPIIGSRLLNVMGLHCIRILFAKLSCMIRWFILAPMMPQNYRRQFHRDGYLLLENFLTPEKVAAIRRDIKAYAGPARQLIQGNTATQRILLDDAALRKTPSLSWVSHHRILKSYLNYTGAKVASPLLYLQRIRNGLKADNEDPQKNIHSDTFHPTVKAWLFLEDVTDEKGPFTYVPSSNQLTFKRLKWEYLKSINAASIQDKYSEKGSMRASIDDLNILGLPKPKAITAKAGTLVIANTNGFHARGQAKAGASRLEVWAYSRYNPFNPFPGLPLPFAKIIKDKVLHFFWHRADVRAAKRNSKSSWHLIESSDMLEDIDT